MNESIENEIDKYARPLFRIITSEKLHMVRGISFAGAGVAMACIIAITTMSKLTICLTASVCFLAFSMPLFLVGALAAENHIWAGPNYFEHYKSVILKPSFF